MPDFNFTVRAVDNSGAFADRNFTITVQNTKIEKFVAITDNDAYTSQDGVKWTRRTDLGGRYVSFGGGVWIITINNTDYYTSPDGIVWTRRSFPSAIYNRGAVWVNNAWWILTYNSTTSSYRFTTSTDGLNWTNSNDLPAGITPVRQGHMAVGGDGTDKLYLSFGNWNASPTDTGQQAGPIYRIYGAVGSQLLDAYDLPNRSQNVHDIKFANGVLVAANIAGVYGECNMYSFNGLLWHTTPTPVKEWNGNSLHYPNSITYGNGYFVCAHGKNTIYGAYASRINNVSISTDGVKWTTTIMPNGWILDSNQTFDNCFAAFSNGTFVIGCDNNSNQPRFVYCQGDPSVSANWKLGIIDTTGNTPVRSIYGIV